MGMFDTIRIEVDLPNCDETLNNVFQTKSFDCTGRTYVITPNRELCEETWNYEMVEDQDRPISFFLKKVPGTMRRNYLTEFTGSITFHDNVKTYNAKIIDGILKEISQ